MQLLNYKMLFKITYRTLKVVHDIPTVKKLSCKISWTYDLILKKLSTSMYIEGLPRWLSGKESSCSAADSGSIPGSGHPLEKGITTHSSVFAWRIPWTDEPGGLQFVESQRVRHNWATKQQMCININILKSRMRLGMELNQRRELLHSFFCLFLFLFFAMILFNKYRDDTFKTTTCVKHSISYWVRERAEHFSLSRCGKQVLLHFPFCSMLVITHSSISSALPCAWYIFVVVFWTDDSS